MARKKDKDDQPGQSNGDGPSEEAPQALLGTAEGGRAATQASSRSLPNTSKISPSKIRVLRNRCKVLDKTRSSR